MPECYYIATDIDSKKQTVVGSEEAKVLLEMDTKYSRTTVNGPFDIRGLGAPIR